MGRFQETWGYKPRSSRGLKTRPAGLAQTLALKFPRSRAILDSLDILVDIGALAEKEVIL
jgi:hypothetical protein